MRNARSGEGRVRIDDKKLARRGGERRGSEEGGRRGGRGEEDRTGQDRTGWEGIGGEKDEEEGGRRVKRIRLRSAT
eukprot:752035-Hanusia_phi.AAC.3